jgi:hypothetical protein
MNVSIPHGMQEVWGSNPHSSTTGQDINPKSKPVMMTTSVVCEGRAEGHFFLY